VLVQSTAYDSQIWRLIAAQFQKIFVINLPSRTDHRDSMALASAFTDLQIEYVDGVTEV
jgi:hypothetical protein